MSSVLPPKATDGRRHAKNSPIYISSRPQSPEASSLAITVDDQPHHPQQEQQPQPPSKPPSTTSVSASASTSAPKPVSAKPKSARHKARTPSPSPPPIPPPPPPKQTIRLDIKLGGPEKYEVDIAALAKETGQRPPTPIPVKRDTSESEGENDDKGGESNKDEAGKPRKRKKKSAAAEYYDVNDPFIDDSELAIDERTFFAQTKQQGFYVSSGEVALLKDKTPRKPKSKKHHAEPSTATQQRLLSVKNDGSKDAPIPLSDVDDEITRAPTLPPYGSVGLLGHVHRDRPKKYHTVFEGSKKKKVVDIESFHPDLQEPFKALKQAIANESWEQKGKFPHSIKPLLNSIAIQAIKLDEYDDDFFNLMPVLFPYNKFTMTKLIKRTVFPDHCKILTDRQEELLVELTALANAGFAKAEEEYEKHLSQWAQRQEQLRVEAELNGRTLPGGDDPSRQGTEDEGNNDMDVDTVHPPPSQSEDKDKDNPGGGTAVHPKENPPSKRYRLTDAMKLVIWQLVSISNELCRLENEKNQYENSMATKSDQALRKSLYQKIVAAFPTGWMSSGQISREVSVMKKKLERENAEND